MMVNNNVMMGGVMMLVGNFEIIVVLWFFSVDEVFSFVMMEVVG